jgi:hypothetical protein
MSLKQEIINTLKPMFMLAKSLKFYFRQWQDRPYHHPLPWINVFVRAIEYIHQTWETIVQMKTVINLLLSKRHKNENWREYRPQCLSASPPSRSLTAGSIKVSWQHSRFVKIWHRIEERVATSILIKKIWVCPWNCVQRRLLNVTKRI